MPWCMVRNLLRRVPLQLFLDTTLGRPLPVQDHIRSDESGNGYALRMAEANDIQFSQLARCMASTGHSYLPNDAAGRIAYLFGADSTDVSLAIPLSFRHYGQTYCTFKSCILRRPYHVRRNWIQICPLCIVEEGYAQAAWEISLVSACPKHQILLVDRCPNCFGKLTWRRPSLRDCNCGADLRRWGQVRADEEEIWLSLIITQKLNDISSMPKLKSVISLLSGLSLDTLVRLVRAIGIGSGKESKDDLRPGRLTRVLGTNESSIIVRRAFTRIAMLAEHDYSIIEPNAMHLKEIEDIYKHCPQHEHEKIFLLLGWACRAEEIAKFHNNLQLDLFYG